MALTLLGRANEIIDEAIVESNEIQKAISENPGWNNKHIDSLNKSINFKLTRAMKFVKTVDDDIKPFQTKGELATKHVMESGIIYNRMQLATTITCSVIIVLLLIYEFFIKGVS